jgi:uncharacterized flavoprotein (TIGR03862 family)
MAAETLAQAGISVLVAEAKPSIGRKFLMAGKSGLNLTMDAPLDAFVAAYPEGRDWLAPMLADFGPEAVQDWARGLGQEVFTGSSGRVFPRAMKASPLLRSWMGRLDALGVAVRTRWRWCGWRRGATLFETPGGPVALRPEATVLALGGGSWARLGSDGAWVPLLAAEDVAVAPFRPSNVGFRVAWSPAMVRHFGAAVKPVRLSVAGRSRLGEFVVSRHGVEGGVIYAVGDRLREGAAAAVDLLPDRSLADVRSRLARPRNGASLSNHLRKSVGLSPVKIALLRECAPDSLGDPEAMAASLKALPLPLAGPRTIDEAISTAGGVRRAALDTGLMLHARPGVFCAGEMLDWDAPTGGYLLTASLATGRWAGRAAVARLGSDPGAFRPG